MFSWFRRKAPEDITTLLVRQAVGGQSVLYRLFRDALSVPESRIDKLELTYFTASVLTFTYLLVRKPPDPAAAINPFADQLLRLAADHNQQTFDDVARAYQRRYRDYLALIPEVLRRENAGTTAHAEALLHQLYESVTGESARGLMLTTVTGTRLVAQFVVDSVDFVRNGLPRTEHTPPQPEGGRSSGAVDISRSKASADILEGDLQRLAPILFPGGHAEISAAGRSIAGLLDNRVPADAAARLFASTRYFAHTAKDKSKQRVVAYIVRQGMGRISDDDASVIYDRFIVGAPTHARKAPVSATPPDLESMLIDERLSTQEYRLQNSYRTVRINAMVFTVMLLGVRSQGWRGAAELFSPDGNAMRPLHGAYTVSDRDARSLAAALQTSLAQSELEPDDQAQVQPLVSIAAQGSFTLLT